MHNQLPPTTECHLVQEHQAEYCISKSGLPIQITTQPYTHELDTRVHAILNEHTKQITQKKGIDTTQALVASDEKQQVIGVIAFRIFWGALHIKYMCTEPQSRKNGVGTLLMEKAIAYAHQNKCPFIFIETLNYQAAEFYQKFGFTIDFVREGFEDKVTFIYMSKKLS